ncbi:ABC transporter ATP-binding protein [Actibacterium sp. 188UL27-1]|uniref:ABC transporter ATP-binding protein n=1 Tax=Actibacterium sp. 188UL27-1 TaxID=2786961 RepID=UPI001956A4F5|nr:ABC transporter ATP-binding protein [Actibacterium sp. 188UL27-1]MBM7069404.1 ABC transporter ATP-binding protein [Actibacterium sp. 188UL27-1]
MGGLTITNLTKRFKDTVVLDDLSLEIEEGQTLVLFGPSGAGKTVLLRCIAGAVEPEVGTIQIGGTDMTDVPPEQRGVGMAFQNFALFPHMSAFDNIASPLTAKRATRDTINDGVQAVARLLKIDHVLGHAPKELSNGQKQRTALARALAAQPKLLLLDDPLRNVDAKLRFEMRLELPRLLAEQGATVVYVTQDYKEAMALGDKIAVLVDGKITQVGTPEQVYLRPADLRIAEQFGDPTINLLDVTPEQDDLGMHIRLSEKRVPLPPGYDGTQGQSCVIGIRPEAIRFTEGPNSIEVTIEAETPFNEKTITLCTTFNGREILISRPAGTDAPDEGKARIDIDATNAVLFDRSTGLRIAPQDTATSRSAAA